jgi:hypothetical protein
MKSFQSCVVLNRFGGGGGDPIVVDFKIERGSDIRFEHHALLAVDRHERNCVLIYSIL